MTFENWPKKFKYCGETEMDTGPEVWKQDKQ